MVMHKLQVDLRRGRDFSPGLLSCRLARCGAGIVLATMLLAHAPTASAGGALAVDDGAILPSGTCHVESWATFGPRNEGLVHIGPACTFERAPGLELGVSLVRGWGDARGTLAGGTAKVSLIDRGSAALALAFSGGVDPATARAAAGVVNAPLTLAVGEETALHLNVGASWEGDEARRHALVFGAGFETMLSPSTILVAEVFRPHDGRASGQAGLRWTPEPGGFDIDLLAGRQGGGATLTIGLTVRR